MNVDIGGRLVGPGHPVYVVAEIGINHNGDLDVARQLIDVAVDAGCDAVKFQKRTPDICTPADQRDVTRDTPWGRMSYLEYRRRIEFDVDGYQAIDEHARTAGIAWFASCWDEPSVDVIRQFDPPAWKIASACLTDDTLIKWTVEAGGPVIASTGMSTLEQIGRAVELLPAGRSVLMHATSTYPCPPGELNLQMIRALARRWPSMLVGYSGHEVGLATTVAAVALGACMVERHITLDRTMWGSDQAASVEPQGLARLVRDIRTLEEALGDGVKRVYASEAGPMARLRRR